MKKDLRTALSAVLAVIITTTLARMLWLHSDNVQPPTHMTYDQNDSHNKNIHPSRITHAS